MSSYYPGFYSPKEVVEVTSVSLKTLYRWRRENKGPPFNQLCTRGTVLYPQKELHQWLEKYKAKKEK